MVRSHEPLSAFTLICDLGLAPIVFALPPADTMDSSSLYIHTTNHADNSNSNSAITSSSSSSSSNTNNSGEVFSLALTYLKNMHHILKNDVLKWCGIGLSSDAETAVQERRLALYSAFLLPFAATQYFDKTCLHNSNRLAKPHPLTRYIMGDMLKLKARDAEHVHLLHSTALDFQLLLRRTVPGPITNLNNKAVWPKRLEAGLILRRAGPLWRIALLLALTGDLGTQHILDNVMRDRRDKEADDAVIGAYASMGKSIQALQLVAPPVWELKPVVDGDAIARLLPLIPKGPLYKEILDEQMKFMLARRNCTPLEVTEYVLQKYSKRCVSSEQQQQ
jgi:hypothetical protein